MNHCARKKTVSNQWVNNADLGQPRNSYEFAEKTDMLGTVVPITALTMITLGNLKSCLQQVLLCRNSPINRAGNYNKKSTRIPSGKQLSLLLLNLCGLKGVWWKEGTKTWYWLLSDMKFDSCCTNSIKEQAITFKACSKEWNALIISLVHTTALSKTMCSWSASYLRQISSSFNSTRLDRMVKKIVTAIFFFLIYPFDVSVSF